MYLPLNTSSSHADLHNSDLVRSITRGAVAIDLASRHPSKVSQDPKQRYVKLSYTFTDKRAHRREYFHLEFSRSSTSRNGTRLPSCPISQKRFSYSCSAVTGIKLSRESICTCCGRLQRSGVGTTKAVLNNQMYRPPRMFPSHLCMVRMVSSCLYLGLERL